MEKYSEWNDKASGVNPFVPVKSPKPSFVAKLVNLVVGTVVGTVRVLLVAVLFLLLAVADGLQSLAPFWMAKRALRRLLVSPIARLMLFVLGYVSVNAHVPDVRRFRLGRTGQASQPKFGSSVQAGDLIVSNQQSFVDILYLAFRFAPNFAYPQQNQVVVLSLTAALLQSLSGKVVVAKGDNATTTVQEAMKLANAQAGSPVALFPEGAPTNGTAVLRFEPVLETLNTKDRVHVLGIKYKTIGAWTVDSPIWLVLRLCSSRPQTMHIVLGAHETISPATSGTTNDDNTSSMADKLRDLLALSVGERGVKKVDFGVKDYIAFVDRWAENKAKTVRRAKKTN